jgi:protein-S-isoprenylcysteine O-methyltransferase Ste14
VNAVADIHTWEKVVIWIPAIVVAVGIIGAVLILLGRAFMDSVRDWGHPRLLAAGAVVLVAAVVVLTWLGVSLPRE